MSVTFEAEIAGDTHTKLLLYRYYSAQRALWDLYTRGCRATSLMPRWILNMRLSIGYGSGHPQRQTLEAQRTIDRP